MHTQLRQLEVPHCSLLALLLLPALSCAAAALASIGRATESTHGVAVHGLHGLTEDVPTANAIASAAAPAAIARMRADYVVPPGVRFGGCERLPLGVLLRLRVLKQAAVQLAEAQDAVQG